MVVCICLVYLWLSLCVCVCREQQSGPAEYAACIEGYWSSETGGIFPEGSDDSG